MDPLTRGVYILMGARFPGEKLTPQQLLHAKSHLTPQEHADLQHARQQAAYWLERRGPAASRQLARWLKQFFSLYGAAFARAGTPLPAMACL